MAGDPRQADTDAVRALLDQATVLSSGAVRLPAMTAAELCMLGAMTTSLIDAQRLVLVDLGAARPAAGAAGDGVAVPGPTGSSSPPDRPYGRGSRAGAGPRRSPRGPDRGRAHPARVHRAVPARRDR